MVTLGLDVWVSYRCSACGKENRLPDTAQVTGSPATILALRRAGQGRTLEQLLPGGVKNAGLRCRCGCGHREPWARLCAPALGRLQKALLILLAVLAAAVYLLHTRQGMLTSVLLLGLGLTAFALLSVTAVLALRRAGMLRKLSALAPQSLPKLELR